MLTIAIGFVLRAVAGAVVDRRADQPLAAGCTILLALFLALSKRRHELVLLADGATEHRPILGEYSPYLLDQMIGVVTASTLDRLHLLHDQPGDGAEVRHRIGSALTIPFPLYGIFRYLYLVHQKEGGGSPAEHAAERSPLLRRAWRSGQRSARRDRLAPCGVRGAAILTLEDCMADFNIRSDSVNVEQIMQQIRARIREKRGVDYTEQQIRELAAVKLERFLDPRRCAPELLEQFRQGGIAPLPRTTRSRTRRCSSRTARCCAGSGACSGRC